MLFIALLKLILDKSAALLENSRVIAEMDERLVVVQCILLGLPSFTLQSYRRGRFRFVRSLTGASVLSTWLLTTDHTHCV